MKEEMPSIYPAYRIKFTGTLTYRRVNDEIKTTNQINDMTDLSLAFLNEDILSNFKNCSIMQFCQTFPANANNYTNTMRSITTFFEEYPPEEGGEFDVRYTSEHYLPFESETVNLKELAIVFIAAGDHAVADSFFQQMIKIFLFTVEDKEYSTLSQQPNIIPDNEQVEEACAMLLREDSRNMPTYHRTVFTD